MLLDRGVEDGDGLVVLEVVEVIVTFGYGGVLRD
jgi:hypothetical protein